MMKKYKKGFFSGLPVFLVICIMMTTAIAGCGREEGNGAAENAVKMDKIYADFVPSKFSEGIAVLHNPYRGFYYMCGFTPDDKSSATAQRDKLIRNLSTVSEDLLLLQFNLSKYRDTELTDTALRQIDAVLDEAKKEEHTVILRFLYDWDNEAYITEPSDIELIGRHIEQFAPVVNEYKDVVFVLQGTLTGGCGEMHTSKYETIDDFKYIMSVLEENIDPDIYLSVRTPWQQRGITGSYQPVSADTAYDGSLGSRLGLFNDGMMGSDTDVGTYGYESFQGAEDPGTKGTREEEIAYQENIACFVPNGGEAITGEGFDELSDLDNAVEEMERTHITYLNQAHDINVINKWKKTTYFGSGVFDGMSGYEYIDAHMGYRFMVSSADAAIDGEESSSLKIDFDIDNLGFAPSYRNFDGEIIFDLISDSHGKSREKVYIQPLNMDIREIKSGETVSYSVEIPLDSIVNTPEDIYRISLKLKDPETETDIQFANDFRDTNEDNSVILGNLTIGW